MGTWAGVVAWEKGKGSRAPGHACMPRTRYRMQARGRRGGGLMPKSVAVRVQSTPRAPFTLFFPAPKWFFGRAKS